MARIVILSGEWAARALLRAELEERGHDAVGVPDLQGLRELPIWPPIDLLIVDAAGLGIDAEEVRALPASCGAAHAILVLGVFDAPHLAPARPAYDHVLVRPVTIGALADAAEAVLAGR